MPLYGGASTASATTAATPVHLRAPTQGDDVNDGYAAGDFWVDTSTGRTWICLNATANAAAWRRYTVTGGPIEAVSGVACAYGAIKLRAAYAGNAFDVVRASDSTTKTIGFLANGQADWATADAFIAGTTGKISQWYDQSGNGVNVTQTTDANRPIINVTNTVNGLRCISFAGDAGSPTYLSHATLPTLDRGNLSCFFIGRQHVQGYPSTWFDFGSGNLAFYTDTWSYFSAATYGNNLTDRSSTFIPAQRFSAYSDASPQVVGLTTGTTNLRFQCGSHSTTLPAIGTGTASGITIGNTGLVSGFQGIFDALGFVVFNTSLNDAGTLQTFMGTASRAFGITPQVRDVLVHAGDSITQGYPTANVGYTVQIQDMLTHPWRVINAGVGAKKASDYQALPSSVATQAKGPGLNVATVFLGTNDLQGNATATQTYNSIVAVCQAWRSAGFKVVVATILPRNLDIGSYTTSGFETARQSVNASIRANWLTFADGLADVGGDPTIGVSAALTNTALFDSSQVHPTSGGHAFIAGIIAAAVNRLQP